MSPRQVLCMGHAKVALAANRKAATATVDAPAPDDDGWFRLNDNLSFVPVHDDKMAFGAAGHYNQSVSVVPKGSRAKGATLTFLFFVLRLIDFGPSSSVDMSSALSSFTFVALMVPFG